MSDTREALETIRALANSDQTDEGIVLAIRGELSRMSAPSPECSALLIDQPGGSPVPATPGMRVALWHQTYANEWDPVPGTILRVGKKFVTIEWDHGGPASRIEPRKLSPWSEPR